MNCLYYVPKQNSKIPKQKESFTVIDAQIKNFAGGTGKISSKSEIGGKRRGFLCLHFHNMSAIQIYVR